MLYVLKKEQIEHARLRALAQAIVSKEKGKEVFDDYMKVAFPWLETQKRRDKDDHIRVLKEEVKKGGLRIVPLWEERMHSRLKHRIVEREKTAPVRSRKELNEFYAKIGKASPL